MKASDGAIALLLSRFSVGKGARPVKQYRSHTPSLMPKFPVSARRRDFLSTLGLGLGGALLGASSPLAGAIEPLQRPGKPRFNLGLAAYSFRQYFRWMRDKEQQVEGREPWEMKDFIDYCAELGVGAEVTSYFFPPEMDAAYLLDVKRHAYLRGVALAGTAIGNTFTLPHGEKLDEQIAYANLWIEHAMLLGAPHIRVFAGSADKSLTHEQAVQQCIETLRQCAAYAADRGVFLGLENHGGVVAEAEPLIEIVKAVDNPWLGINLDSGNFHTADPYGDLAKIAPYAVNVQLKCEMKPKDKPAEPMDTERVVKILKDAGYQGWFTLEYEAAEDPFTAVPQWIEKMRAAIA